MFHSGAKISMWSREGKRAGGGGGYSVFPYILFQAGKIQLPIIIVSCSISHGSFFLLDREILQTCSLTSCPRSPVLLHYDIYIYIYILLYFFR